MLKNRITQLDLRHYDSSIEKYRPPDLASWQPQINEAFEVIKDKIRSRGIDTRKVCIPLDLNRLPTETAAHHALTALTETANYTGSHIVGHDGFRRFIVNVTALTGTGYAFTLQGSNDQNISDAVEPANWSDIISIDTTEAKEYSLVFTDEYMYYRVILVVTQEDSPSITFQASILETYIDRWIILLSLHYVYGMMKKTPDDVWKEKSVEALANFDLAFDSYTFTIDSDSDNLVDDTDDIKKSSEPKFWR